MPSCGLLSASPPPRAGNQFLDPSYFRGALCRGRLGCGRAFRGEQPRAQLHEHDREHQPIGALLERNAARETLQGRRELLDDRPAAPSQYSAIVKAPASAFSAPLSARPSVAVASGS
jgi:hypothetical protein